MSLAVKLLNCETFQRQNHGGTNIKGGDFWSKIVARKNWHSLLGDTHHNWEGIFCVGGDESNEMFNWIALLDAKNEAEKNVTEPLPPDFQNSNWVRRGMPDRARPTLPPMLLRGL
jgi:hypothetical protein